MRRAAPLYNPNLAEKTRVKRSVQFTKEEREWAALDKVLHPEVCQMKIST
jgi:hypothetical protein